MAWFKFTIFLCFPILIICLTLVIFLSSLGSTLLVFHSFHSVFTTCLLAVFLLFYIFGWSGVWTHDVLPPEPLHTFPFCVGYFWDRVLLYTQVSLVYDPVCASYTDGMTGACHHASHCLRWGLMNFFARLASNHDPQGARITCLSQCLTFLWFFF
jgi:hypothetical protein